MNKFTIMPRRYLHRHYIMGDDAHRETYEQSRRKSLGADYVQREKAALEFAQSASFTIPPERGFLVVPPGTFDEIEPLTLDVQERIAKMSDEELHGSKKAQLRNRLLPPRDVTLDSPYLRFALREDVLAAVGNYLGVAPVLADVDIWYSLHRGGTLSNSQLYHCDWDAVRQMKIFVYACDVDQSNGPLTLISADDSKRLRDDLGYVYGYADVKKLSDEDIGKAMNGAQQHAIEGARGTAIFGDTSRCFHFGSRSEKPRLLAFFQYFSPTSFKLAHNYKEGLPFRALAGEASLSPLQKLALGGA